MKLSVVSISSIMLDGIGRGRRMEMQIREERGLRGISDCEGGTGSPALSVASGWCLIAGLCRFD